MENCFYLSLLRLIHLRWKTNRFNDYQLPSHSRSSIKLSKNLCEFVRRNTAKTSPLFIICHTCRLFANSHTMNRFHSNCKLSFPVFFSFLSSFALNRIKMWWRTAAVLPWLTVIYIATSIPSISSQVSCHYHFSWRFFLFILDFILWYWSTTVVEKCKPMWCSLNFQFYVRHYFCRVFKNRLHNHSQRRQEKKIRKFDGKEAITISLFPPYKLLITTRQIHLSCIFHVFLPSFPILRHNCCCVVACVHHRQIGIVLMSEW